jgi:hypothetical protein
VKKLPELPGLPKIAGIVSEGPRQRFSIVNLWQSWQFWQLPYDQSDHIDC